MATICHRIRKKEVVLLILSEARLVQQTTYRSSCARIGRESLPTQQSPQAEIRLAMGKCYLETCGTIKRGDRLTVDHADRASSAQRHRIRPGQIVSRHG